MTAVEGHPWAVSVQEAFRIQEDLRERLVLEDVPEPPRTIAGVDVAFSRARGLLHAAIVVLDARSLEPVETASATLVPVFPYIPGLLTFREGPAVLAAYDIDGMKWDDSGRPGRPRRSRRTRSRTACVPSCRRADPQTSRWCSG